MSEIKNIFKLIEIFLSFRCHSVNSLTCLLARVEIYEKFILLN